MTIRPVRQSATDALLSAYADFSTEATGQPFRTENAAALPADRPTLPHLTLGLLARRERVAAQVAAAIAGEATPRRDPSIAHTCRNVGEGLCKGAHVSVGTWADPVQERARDSEVVLGTGSRFLSRYLLVGGRELV